MKVITMADLRGFAKNERGATAIEYSLIAAGIALAIVAAVTLLGESVVSLFNIPVEALQ